MAGAMVVVVVILFMHLILFLVLLFSWSVVSVKVLRIVTLSSVNNHQTIQVQIMVVISGSGDSLHDQSGDRYHEYKLQNILGTLIDINHLKKFLFKYDHDCFHPLVQYNDCRGLFHDYFHLICSAILVRVSDHKPGR